VRIASAGNASYSQLAALPYIASDSSVSSELRGRSSLRLTVSH